jgi:NCAIR mutase (PurE)-related protein
MEKRMEKRDDLRFDESRLERCGFPEFIFGAGKTPEQVVEMASRIADAGQALLATRLDADSADALEKTFPEGERDDAAKTFLLLPDGFEPDKGRVAIVTAGTTDLPVALEAKHTLAACGCRAEMVVDAGVAGIHRVLSETENLRSADAVIVVAGMEGALPSVVAGLVPCPVVAVPTSVGYGAALGGLTAMFAMLNSCANGVTVVNIDNGFGAACAAARIVLSKSEKETIQNG